MFGQLVHYLTSSETQLLKKIKSLESGPCQTLEVTVYYIYFDESHGHLGWELFRVYERQCGKSEYLESSSF